MEDFFEMEETEEGKTPDFLVIKGASDIRRAGVENITFAYQTTQYIIFFFGFFINKGITGFATTLNTMGYARRLLFALNKSKRAPSRSSASRSSVPLRHTSSKARPLWRRVVGMPDSHHTDTHTADIASVLRNAHTLSGRPWGRRSRSFRSQRGRRGPSRTW